MWIYPLIIFSYLELGLDTMHLNTIGQALLRARLFLTKEVHCSSNIKYGEGKKRKQTLNNNGVFIPLRGQSPILVYPRRKVRLSAQTSSLEQEGTTNGTIPNGKVRVSQVPIVTSPT